MFKENNKFEKFESKVWLSSPTMHGLEIEYVKEAYETNWMSTVGKNINEVERMACEYIGCKYAVALSAGTASLHLAMKLAGIEAYGMPKVGHGALEGKKVFCSDMTFDATVNPIVYEGGIPVFIDTEYDTWNMDPVALEKAFELYPDVKVVVIAHLYGPPGKIDEIKAGSAYDTLEISGSRASWPDVLAVYAVKTNTDPDAAQEVATMDDNKKALLRSIFWDMHVISHRTETRTETETIVTDDGHGNLVESQQTVTKTYLLISITHSSVADMVAQYSFSGDQQAQLAELQKPEYADLWRQVLYGISSGGSGDIVEIAAAQIGNEGGAPFWSWYGFDSRVEWCACFVSWCANEAGYIETGVIPKFAACQSQGVAWFKERGQWQDGGYTPAPGEIIFFDWGGDGSADHVGIVESVADGSVNTIEGNSGDTCRQKSYAIGSSVIYGYGIPAY